MTSSLPAIHALGPRRLATLAASGVMALTLAACSSGSGGSAPSTTASGPSTTASGAATTASGSSTTAAGGPSSSGGSLLADAPVAPSSAIPAGSPMAKIRKQGYLSVGGTVTAPLFALKNPVTGQVEGFDADMARMLAKYIIGKPVVHRVQTTAATRETLLQNGTVDTVIATYTITAARAKKVAFAGPYYSSGDAILVKKTNTSIKGVKDLDGKTVVTELNSTAAKDIHSFAPKAKVTLFDTNNECLQAVEQGRADAYVLDQAILLGDATRSPDVKLVGQPFTKEPYGIGLPHDQTKFKAFVNSWIKKIESDGEWAKAWKATIGTAVPGGPPAPPAVGSVPGS